MYTDLIAFLKLALELASPCNYQQEQLVRSLTTQVQQHKSHVPLHTNPYWDLQLGTIWHHQENLLPVVKVLLAPHCVITPRYGPTADRFFPVQQGEQAVTHVPVSKCSKLDFTYLLVATKDGSRYGNESVQKFLSNYKRIL